MYMRLATIVILLTSLLGCGDIVSILTDDTDQPSNPFVGTWLFDSVDGEPPAGILADISQDSDDTFAFFEFYNDGTWQLFVNSFSGENLIALHILLGTYTVDGESYSMTVGESGFIDIAPDDRTTSGVYEIEGDTLTLHDDDGSVIVLSTLL